MKYMIVYQSRTGNTGLLAENIKEILGEAECCYYGEPNERAKKAIFHADFIFVGFWTDKGNCGKELQQFLSDLEGKKIALFGTAGFGGDKEYFKQILSRVKQIIPDTNHILDSFMCQGKMPLSVKERYEQMLENNKEDKNIEMLLANFDLASSHPDKTDLAELKNWLDFLKNKF